jgi:hypothetical protein
VVLQRRSEHEDALSRLASENPVTFALAQKVEERLRKAVDSVTRLLAEGKLDKIPAELGQLADIDAISSWLAPPGSSTQTNVNWARVFRDAGHSDHDIVGMVSGSQKEVKRKKSGRPPSTRWLAVQAKEMRLLDPKLSWSKLTKKLCPCGQLQHSDNCKQAIRQGVLALERTLKKLEIEVHPVKK